MIAQAVTAAVDGCSLAIAALPATEDPEFTERAAPILADLRQLEAIAVQATRISRITPELIKALGAVRRHHDELMRLGATALVPHWRSAYMPHGGARTFPPWRLPKRPASQKK